MRDATVRIRDYAYRHHLFCFQRQVAALECVLRLRQQRVCGMSGAILLLPICKRKIRRTTIVTQLRVELIPIWGNYQLAPLDLLNSSLCTVMQSHPVELSSTGLSDTLPLYCGTLCQMNFAVIKTVVRRRRRRSSPITSRRS